MQERKTNKQKINQNIKKHTLHCWNTLTAFLNTLSKLNDSFFSHGRYNLKSICISTIARMRYKNMWILDFSWKPANQVKYLMIARRTNFGQGRVFLHVFCPSSRRDGGNSQTKKGIKKKLWKYENGKYPSIKESFWKKEEQNYILVH